MGSLEFRRILVMSLSMKELFILIAHLLTTLVRLAQPGSVRSVIAQSLTLRHQLLVLQRRRKRAPRLAPWDRLLYSAINRVVLNLAVGGCRLESILA